MVGIQQENWNEKILHGVESCTKFGKKSIIIIGSDKKYSCPNQITQPRSFPVKWSAPKIYKRKKKTDKSVAVNPIPENPF